MIADESLTQLLDLAALKSVDLSGSQVEQLPTLSRLTELKELNLSNTNVQAIEQLRGVESLEVVNLEGTRVASSVTSVLKTLPNLRDLDLSNTLVDEFVLLELAEMRQLKRLRIASQALPAAAIEKFRKKSPECELVLE